MKLLSIGRFSHQKNFDNVPYIASRIKQDINDMRWYLIGFGPDEELIKYNIKKAGMEECVILLGKKENPYPYIKACDIYVQPSRYEGKSVTVREAQMLYKPVIITNYLTASSQVKHGYDGIIVPLDNEGCAQGIISAIKNRELLDQLSKNCRNSDFSNLSEINKLYKIIENI